MIAPRALAGVASAILAACLVGPSALPVTGAGAATPATASQAYGWGGAQEVWDWEQGQAIAPWTDWADGTGRATNFIGMIALDSGPMATASTGDVVSLLDAPGHSRGRWEFKVRAPQFGTLATPYAMRVELVPRGTAPGACPSPTITVAAWSGYDAATTYGVHAGDTQWTGSVGLPHDRSTWHTVAVEVTDSFIAWFADGQVRGQLTRTQDPTAIPVDALVPRLVLDGEPGATMTHTRLTADWDRWYSLQRPDLKSVAAPAPLPGDYAGDC